MNVVEDDLLAQLGKVVEAISLTEELARTIARALNATHRAATATKREAVSAYRRCRELLSIVLGLKPSMETDRLYREISARAGA